MGNNIRIAETETVALNAITPHPQNARRGDIDKIAESLDRHGQYKPIVVNKRDNCILAGNHTYKAVKKLKWSKIAVVWVDVDETTAKKIMIADNRTSDLSSYNEDALFGMLSELPDLAGTGFTDDDLANLSELLNSPFTPDDKPTREAQDDEYQIVLGKFRGTLDAEIYEAWEEAMLADNDNKRPRVIATIKDWLKMPQPTPPMYNDPATLLSPPERVEAVLVDVDQLRPYPQNPREGDIGAIAQSLQELGQYRPIVVRTDGTILAGNHTYQAVKALGWKQIAVTYIQCTDDEASRIVLVDNRTSDHGTYDRDALRTLIASLPDWKGTGYEPSDVNELLAGGAPSPAPDTTGKTTCKVGNFAFRMPKADINRWCAGLTHEDISYRLQIPEQGIIYT